MQARLLWRIGLLPAGIRPGSVQALYGYLVPQLCLPSQIGEGAAVGHLISHRAYLDLLRFERVV